MFRGERMSSASDDDNFQMRYKNIDTQRGKFSDFDILESTPKTQDPSRITKDARAFFFFQLYKIVRPQRIN